MGHKLCAIPSVDSELGRLIVAFAAWQADISQTGDVSWTETLKYLLRSNFAEI